MKLVAASLATAACVAVVSSSASPAPTFNEFALKFGKKYSNWAERIQRHKIYDANVAEISRLSKAGLGGAVSITKVRAAPAMLACWSCV